MKQPRSSQVEVYGTGRTEGNGFEGLTLLARGNTLGRYRLTDEYEREVQDESVSTRTDQPARPDRRGSRMSALVFAVVLAAPGVLFPDQPAPGTNPIQCENRREGSSDWQLTRVRLDRSDGCRSAVIEGYCSQQSVAAGEKLQIMVSTEPAARFQMEIFRTGHYGGRGARLMKKVGPVAGRPQPTPKSDERTMHECRWEPSAELTIPKDWLSGVYLGRLTTLPEAADQPYWQSYVVFIVRDDRPADILFQCSDNTWQAYNGWPYKTSMYTHPKGNGPWADVSFDRPYGREAQYTAIVNDPLSVGSGAWLTFEFPLAYWLEQHGYDVSYCSNSDMITPDRGLKCKACSAWATTSIGISASTTAR